MGLKIPSPPSPLLLPVFSFPSRKNRRGCSSRRPLPVLHLPPSSPLGLGISHGGLSFCIGIRREWRPHPPLALRALDFDSILFRCWILVPLCCVAVQGRLCVLALMLGGERQQAWQAQGARLALTAVVWQVAAPAATPRRAAGSGKQ